MQAGMRDFRPPDFRQRRVCGGNGQGGTIRKPQGFDMKTTRRDLLKLGALATATAALPAIASSGAAPAAVGKAAKPLNILILGGTGFTGPFQVQ